MLKLAVIALVVLFSVQVYAQNGSGDFVTAFPAHFSWESIFSNNTSYLDEIDVHRDVIYVSSEGLVREIVENPFEFSAHHAYFRQPSWVRYLDFKVFEHHGVSYVFGPVTYSWRGINHALRIATVDDDDYFNLPGHIQISSIVATETIGDHVAVYGAGWYINVNDTTDHFNVNFCVVRMFLHPNHTHHHNGSFVTFDEATDLIQIPTWGYTEYTREFKPWVFHSYMLQQVIVVDPATDRIYRFKAPNMRNETFSFLTVAQAGYSSTNITSATYGEGMLIIGTRSRGIYPGHIVAYDITTPANPGPHDPLNVLFALELKEFESNPKALAIRHDGLYVGFSGGSYILHLNITTKGQRIGYATLPWYSRNVHDMYSSRHHLYIVTNEQFAKIARTNHSDFCPNPCDSLYGYCYQGQCACHPGHVLNETAPHYPGHCSPNFVTNDQIVVDEHTTSYHAGEIAMGLLFAICFVAAAAGWFVVWRNHQGKSVPFGLGSGGGSRYSAVNRDEKEGFLGSLED